VDDYIRGVQPVLGPTKESTMGPFAVAAATSAALDS
jgi:hypothetical protein